MQEILKHDLMCARQCDKLRLKDENKVIVVIIQHDKCYNRGKLKVFYEQTMLGK